MVSPDELNDAGMRITFVNTHDVIGGAERCSYDLARSFRAAGDDATLLVGRKLGDGSFVKQLSYHPWDWKLRSFAHGRLGLTDTTILAPLYGCFTIDALRDADLYNIHNMHGAYWNFWTLPLLARRAPVVLTLHDEWFLTGDCAYTYECERWRKGCGSCPQATEKEPGDRVCIGGADATKLNLKLKRMVTRFLDPRRVAIVSPSAWLAGQAERSPHLARFRRVRIPYGVDLEVYRPRDRQETRRRWGVVGDDFLVLASAANLFDKRKNLRLVLDALREPNWPLRARLVLVGRMSDAIKDEIAGNPRCLPMGYQREAIDMARAMSACDLAVVPSRSDNFPYTALEAQACGLPVLAADTGGIPETIEANATGWLFDPTIAAGAFAEEIARIMTLQQYSQNAAGKAARERALEHFSMARFVSAYRNLFSELIATR